MLHTLLAGDPPFTGDNEMAMLHRLTTGSIPNALPLTVPQNVRAILKGAMCFDREARIPTCALLQEALEGALTENGTPTNATDVAAYSAQYLTEAAGQRHDAVRAALDSASARWSMRPPTASGAGSSNSTHASLAHRSLVEDSGNAVSAATEHRARDGAAAGAVDAVDLQSVAHHAADQRSIDVGKLVASRCGHLRGAGGGGGRARRDVVGSLALAWSERSRRRLAGDRLGGFHARR